MPRKADESGSLTLAVDQGTHATRALVFTATGRCLARGERDIRLTRPARGLAEHDPEEVVRSVFEAAEDALERLGDARSNVTAAGLACQRACCVLWDRESGRTLSPVFSWQDRRSHEELEAFESHADEVRRRSGLPLSAHYGATKLGWWLDRHEDARQVAREGRLAFGPLASFLVHRMTRGRPLVAEPQTASRTQLWSVADRDWDPWLLDLFRVPRDVLPDCVPTIHPFGTFAVAGLEIPVTAVNGDQAAALFSLGPAALDVATVNAGSGAFVLRVMERPAPAPRLLSGVALDDGTDVRFVLEGTVNGAASALDRLAAESGTPDLMRRLPRWLEGAGPPPLFLNGVAGLGSPFWVHDYRSRFVGKGGPRRRAAAVVESIAFLLRANLDEMERHVPSPLSIRITGGLSRLDGLCRVLAGLTGVEVSRRDDPEATARGIAFLAAGRPATWRPIPASDRFPPGRDEALADRYARWREIMRRETGV